MFKKLSFSSLGSAFLLLALSTVAFAAGEEVATAGLKYFSVSVFAAGIGIGIAAFGTGIGQGIGIRGAVEGIARNPEASGKVTVTMLIGLAMVESLCIYALVIALILIYAHPQSSAIAKLFAL
ncbi:MAG: ATP synthase F0 subunit C [Desulfobacterales bacterium]|nr:ATP synthase F0 subunit C [Desulfobacterales bacterium]